MIADKSQVQVTGKLEGEQVGMSIAPDAMAHIMSILTDLYSDPEMAVLREYSTNAYDEHLLRKVVRPIEVTTPSNLSQYLRIRDFGGGLSVEDIHNIYSKYGASTKRETNDLQGMLGLGCKSGLTYAPQFTLTSVKDGTRVQVAVSRDADGVASMTIVDTSATTDPPGTEVMIPAKREHQFAFKAAALFQYWPKGSVLVNGEAPTHFLDHPNRKFLKITDGLYLCPELDRSYVVMGNVAYPVEDGRIELPENQRVLAFVPIGAVTFAPNREALMYHQRTLDTCKGIGDTYAKHISEALQTAINQQADAPTAMALALEWRHKLPKGTKLERFRYRGHNLRPNIEFPDDKGNRVYRAWVTRRSYYGRHSTSYDRIPVESAQRMFFVENYTLANFAAAHRRRIEAYMTANGMNAHGPDGRINNVCLLTGKVPDTTYVPDRQIATWEQIKAATKAVDEFTGAGYSLKSIPGSYDCYIDGNHRSEVPGDEIPKRGTLVYANGNRWDLASVITNFQTLAPKGTFVCLPLNRIEKFKRLFPRAQQYNSWIEAQRKKVMGSLTRDERLALYIQHSGTSYYSANGNYTSQANQLAALDETRVKDPDLVKAIVLAKRDVRVLWSKVKAAEADGAVMVRVKGWVCPLQKYPLYSSNTLRDHKEHVYEYINGVYAKNRRDDE